MKLTTRHRQHLSAAPWGKTAVLLLLVGLAIQNTGAQSVLAPPPTIPITPPAVVEAQSRLPEGNLLPPPPPSTGYESPFQWGPVTLHPHAMYRFSYGNGINASPTDRENTVVQEILPGILLNAGRSITLDYTPTLRFYSSDEFRDTVDHNVAFNAGGSYQEWVYGVSQTYAKTSQPLVETGTQTDQESFLTGLNATYQMNSKMSLDFGVDQDITSTTGFNSWRNWSTLDWLNYNLYQRITISLGAGVGYLDYDVGSDTLSEQLQARVIWHATDKIGLQIHGGAEDRQFLDNSADDLINPVFGASLDYRPIEVTTLTIAADRAVTPSYFNAQITETTTVGASLSQRVLGKVFLTLSGGYTTRKYVSTSNVDTGRSDDYYFFGARATVHVIKRATVSAFYQYSKNESSQSSLYSFDSNQVGLELGYSY